MGKNISEEERAFSQKIYNFRRQGKVADAMEVCRDAIKEFGDSNFFYKIYGDLLFENTDFDKALEIYLIFLNKIKDHPEYFTNFAKFFKRLNGIKVVDEKIFNQLARIVTDNSYPYILKKGMMNLLIDTFILPQELEQMICRALNSFQIETIKEDYTILSTGYKCRELVYLCRISEKNCKKEENDANRYILKRLEKNGLFEQAINWTKRILNYSNDSVVVRTLLRLCRESSDYSAAEDYLSEKKNIETEEFNIQYEMVLYFDWIGDEEKRNKALTYIEKLATNSLPISRTLFKFYVKFDMFDKAQRIQKSITNFSQNKDTQIAKKEAEDIVWNRLRTLVTEQEHNRQLLAMADLIKGFSHELGQPITNIRYSIQLFFMKNKKENHLLSNDEQDLFNSILNQTERVGRLLNRFSPITSSKSEKVFFNVLDSIINIFDELSSRLKNEKISFLVKGDNNIKIYGEELQFGQVFYNLIINSIYAIKRKGNTGKINVDISRKASILRIAFCDNGIGIPPESRRKIFNPFFSTKDKEVEEGGEGLGLFIVWNILKIFSGRIFVDENYNLGAKFVIEINLKENSNV